MLHMDVYRDYFDYNIPNKNDPTQTNIHAHGLFGFSHETYLSSGCKHEHTLIVDFHVSSVDIIVPLMHANVTIPVYYIMILLNIF